MEMQFQMSGEPGVMEMISPVAAGYLMILLQGDLQQDLRGVEEEIRVTEAVFPRIQPGPVAGSAMYGRLLGIQERIAFFEGMAVPVIRSFDEPLPAAA